MTLRLLLLAAALAAASGQEPAQPKRARDPWIFRCVLDQRPRMVTLALSDEMWVAYDATTCGLYKAWKGGVVFDGPVYTTVHGPQPTSRGLEYTHGLEGDVWEANVGGADVAAKAVWKGYRLFGNHAALEYEIVLPDGRRIPVQETPEFVLPERMFDEERRAELALVDGRPGLLRTFLARDVPDDVKVSLRLRTDGATGKLAETLERERFVDEVDAQGVPHTKVFSHLALTKARPSSTLVLFFEPLPAPTEPEPVKK